MGLATSIVGAGWFLACTKLIIPAANGGGEPFYTALFPGYGNCRLHDRRDAGLPPDALDKDLLVEGEPHVLHPAVLARRAGGLA